MTTKRNNRIMLWGIKKASQEQLNDVLGNLTITVEKKEKGAKKESKVTKKDQRDYYDPTLEYTVKDIDFLDEELEKLNEDYENQKFDRLEDKNVQKYYDIKKISDLDSDEKEDILYKMIDKLERLVEVLKDYNKEEGKGIETDSDEEDIKNFNKELDKIDKEIAKKNSKTANKPSKTVTPKKEPIVTKARVEKGSSDAKEKMAKLTAIRQAKKAEKDKEKEKEKQTKLKEKESKKKHIKSFKKKWIC